MSDKIRIKLYVNTGYPSAKHEDYEEVDREEWEALSEKQRDEWLEEAAQTYMANCIEYGAYVDEEN